MALLFTGKGKAELFLQLKSLIEKAVANTYNETYYNTKEDLEPFTSELKDVNSLLLSCSAPYVMDEIRSHTKRIVKLIEKHERKTFSKKEKAFVSNMVESYFVNEMMMAMRASKAMVQVVA